MAEVNLGIDDAEARDITEEESLIRCGLLPDPMQADAVDLCGGSPGGDRSPLLDYYENALRELSGTVMSLRESLDAAYRERWEADDQARRRAAALNWLRGSGRIGAFDGLGQRVVAHVLGEEWSPPVVDDAEPF